MKYGDIIHFRRPESSHPRMHRQDRAKLFAPFAALSGHSRAVQARETVFYPKISMTPDTENVLNEKLCGLKKGDRVTAVFFVSRRQTETEVLGVYQTITDVCIRADAGERVLYLRDHRIDFDDLLDIRVGENEFVYTGEIF